MNVRNYLTSKALGNKLVCKSTWGPVPEFFEILKMPRKREIQSRKSTRAVRKWSVKNSLEWQNGRNNKNFEPRAFTTDNQVQRLDTDIANMTAESLNLWLIKFVVSVSMGRCTGQYYKHFFNMLNSYLA